MMDGGSGAARTATPPPRRRQLRVASMRFGAAVVVVLDLVLVADDLAVELVHQLVDRGVKIFRGALGEQVLALDVNGHLGLLSAFLLGRLLDREQDRDVDHLVEVPRDPVELGEHVFAYRRSHVEVMTADRQVHVNPFGSAAGDGSRAAVACLVKRVVRRGVRFSLSPWRKAHLAVRASGRPMR